MSPANCCSRHLYMTSVTCWYSRSSMLTRHLAKHLSDFRRRPAHNVAQSLLCSSSSSTTAGCEIARFCWQYDCRSSSPCVAPVILNMSQSRSSSFYCSKAKHVGHQNQPLSFHQFRHYMPRPLTPSTKTIVEASPLSLQPYLRLIRFDRPIGRLTYTLILTALLHWSQCRPLYKLGHFGPSVCHSVTFRCFGQTNEDTIVQFSESGRTILLLLLAN